MRNFLFQLNFLKSTSLVKFCCLSFKFYKILLFNLWCNNWLISTSNHIFGRAWVHFLKFQNFKIFKNHEDDLSKKLPEPNMWLLFNYTIATNILYRNWYLLTSDNYKSVSGQLKSNTINSAMSITINPVIIKNNLICRKLPFPTSFIMGMAKLSKITNYF